MQKLYIFIFFRKQMTIFKITVIYDAIAINATAQRGQSYQKTNQS